ncbi:hypothetical protein, partial [Mycobacterium avium]|uniref:hypothetical protein n=1 Tax=Mycobacterium avium TaxID=1764 RepID=UPI001F1625EC
NSQSLRRNADRPYTTSRGTTSAIRHGTRVVATRHGFVRVQMRDGRREKVSQAHLIAVAAHGWPEYWTCEKCRETVPYILGRLDELGDDSPDNLKWVPDAEAMLWHVIGCCLENLMAGKPHEEEPNREWVDSFVYDIEAAEFSGETYMCHPTSPKTEKLIQWGLKKEYEAEHQVT